MGEQGHGTRQHTISIGAVFWTLRRLQKELSENSDDQPHGRVELEEEDAAATAVDALLAEFCDNAVPVAQRAAAVVVARGGEDAHRQEGLPSRRSDRTRNH